MNFAALILYVALAAPAPAAPAADAPGAGAPAPAAQGEPAAPEKATVTIRLVSVKEGSDADEKIDGRLADKLRTTLKQFNLFKKPDLGLVRTRSGSVAPGESVEAHTGPYVAVATCKSVSAEEGVTLRVELFTEVKDPKTRKTVRKLDVGSPLTLKDGEQMMPYAKSTPDGIRLFVVSAVREAPARQPPPPPAPDKPKAPGATEEKPGAKAPPEPARE